MEQGTYDVRAAASAFVTMQQTFSSFDLKDQKEPQRDNSTTSNENGSSNLRHSGSSWKQGRPMRTPTASDKQSASDLKLQGNALVKKEKYSAALECYTSALLLHRDPALLTNRALCHKKRGDWARVAEDSLAALSLNSSSLKAHYYLGLALRQSSDLPGSISHLTKALEQARESGDSIKDEIWRELATAKYRNWEQVTSQRQADHETLKKALCRSLQMMHQQEADSGHEHPEELRQRHAWESSATEAMFDELSAGDRPGNFSSAFSCRLTLEPFREPVVSTSGLSYERTALLQHLREVGQFDPVTRVPLTESQLKLNLGLRSATQEYLDQNAWAWKDCV